MIIHLSKENLLVEKNDPLQKRIKDGANYFYNEISKWDEQFFNHPLSVTTKKLARKIDGWLEVISYILQEILQKIGYCRNGFLLEEYLKSRKFLVGKVKQIKSSYTKDKTLKLNTAAETVKYLREGKSIEQIAEVRKLVISTVESHLAQAIKNNFIQIGEIIPIDEARKISEYFSNDLDNVRLAQIKEKAPKEITYGKLRMVLAWLQKGKS